MTTRIQTFGGNIGIGTDDPGSFKLNVNGDVKADSLVINGVTNSHIPIGLLGIWYGTVASIPTGWKICNGNAYTRSDGNGTITTPNLINQFIRGATSTPQVDQTAGNNTVTLSEANLAGHTHTFTTQTNSAPHEHGTSSNSNAPHGHGNSTQNNMPHDHAITTGNAPHGHGESTNAPFSHGHNAIAGSSQHTHNAVVKDVPHSHVVESTNQNTRLTSGSGGKMRRSSTETTATTASPTSDAPHYHDQMPTIAVTHLHPNSQHNANHPHTTEDAGPQHAHGIPSTSGSASHAHSDVTPDNMNHPHVSNASNMLHPHEGTTGQTGQGNAITITNPYYILAYIMKI
jgi:hypothetical protein